MPVSRRTVAGGALSLFLAAGTLPFAAGLRRPEPDVLDDLPVEGLLPETLPVDRTPQVRSASADLVAAATLPDEEAARRALGASAGAALLFAELPVEHEATVAGVTWPRDTPASGLAVRTLAGGVPGPWEPLEIDDASAPEGGGTGGSDAIVLAGVERVQVAAVAGRTPLTLQLFASPDLPESDAAPAPFDAVALAANPAAKARPAIRSRADWRAMPAAGTPVYGVVTGALVHHTASGNSYSAAAVPGLLRAMQAYHILGRRWSDIAYNVIVDRFGVAWEGRGGGLDRAVIGAHSYGITNERLFGVSLLGDYNRVAPSPAMLATLQQVIAWKFLVHGVNPYGVAVGTSGRLAAISGHRDDRATSCPGRYVYARIGELRAGVRARMSAAGGRPDAPTAQLAPTRAAAAPAAPAKAPAATRAPRVAVTGTMDPATVRAMQAWLGIAVTGRWRADTTRALQSRVGARVTGALDNQTTRRVQATVGVKVDGLWGRGTTAALQRYLNSR